MSEVYIKEPATKGKAIFRTSHGDLEIELWATECPKACRNFCQLILEGYYNDTIIHRVIKDFCIQGGDATGTGDSTESIYGKPYPDEIHPRLKFRYRGMMGVASAGKGTKTNGSQFFIVLNRAPSLDGKHTLFGRIVGQTVYNLLRIADAECDKDDRPVDPAPKIHRAELVWDPFGDLEPRRLALPPAPVAKAPEEVQRRAPVKNKKILSFGEDSDGDDDEADAKNAGGRGKSAHDLLNDPKLLPGESGSGAAKAAEKREKRAEAEAAKPPAARAEASRPEARGRAPTGKRKNADLASEGSSGEDSDDSDDNDVVDARSKQRQDTIAKLKRDIAGIGASKEDEEKEAKRPRSALEERQAGYVTRNDSRGEAPRGKEGRRRAAAGVMNSLKSFQDSLRTVVKAQTGAAAADAKKKEPGKTVAEEGTFAAIWDEGDEEGDADWLAGDGLKFHTSGDKAFQLANLKARETLDVFDPLVARGNDEMIAATRKSRSLELDPSKLKHAPSKVKLKKDDKDRDRRR